MRLTILGCAVLAIATGCDTSGGGFLGLSTGTGGGTGRATKLAFTVQPTGAAAGGTMPAVQVSAENAAGVADTTDTAAVTVGIGTNPSSGSLGGITTIKATAGVAVFNSLTISKAGNGYTLTASQSGLTSATSSAFNITP